MVFDYMLKRPDKVFEYFLEHLEVAGISVLLAILIGVPLGILITRHERLASVVLYVAGIIQTIPSLAMFGFLIPIFGIGLKPAVVALVLYGQLSIIRNTYAGIKNVSSDLVEAGRGMGMTEKQILFMVELPVAFSVILGGVRTALVTIVGIATIAAWIGAGGLGHLIIRGINTINMSMTLAGAIPAALLSLAVDFLMGKFEKAVDPMNRKSKPGRKVPVVSGDAVGGGM